MIASTPTSASQRTQRSGFTLLELMLVLAIIAAIGAIVTPSLGAMWERSKLRGATDALRLRWDQARLEAMRTGQNQVFECEPGTGNFSVKPLVLQADTTTAGTGATLLSGGALVETQDNGFMTSADTEEFQGETLEETITFVHCLVVGDMRAYSITQESLSGGSGVNDLNTSNIGQRVIFYADGSTSTAEVQIKNSRGDVKAVQMRGLTGHTRSIEVSNVASGDEAQ